MAEIPAKLDKAKALLTKKVGPLPGWAWFGIGIVGLVLIRRRRANKSPTASVNTPLAPGSGGGVVGGGSPGSGSGYGIPFGGSGGSGGSMGIGNAAGVVANPLGPLISVANPFAGVPLPGVGAAAMAMLPINQQATAGGTQQPGQTAFPGFTPKPIDPNAPSGAPLAPGVGAKMLTAQGLAPYPLNNYKPGSNAAIDAGLTSAQYLLTQAGMAYANNFNANLAMQNNPAVNPAYGDYGTSSAQQYQNTNNALIASYGLSPAVLSNAKGTDLNAYLAAAPQDPVSQRAAATAWTLANPSSAGM